MADTALLIYGINPIRIGGIELQVRALAERMQARGWRCVLCFDRRPDEPVLSYLSLRNVIWDALPNAWGNSFATARELARLLRTYRPRILHMEFTPGLSLYPWLARCLGVKKITFRDQGSRPEGYVSRAASLPKRLAGRLASAPLAQVIGISDYNCRTTIARGYVDPSRVTCIYNGTDLTLERHRANGVRFRERYGIPPDRILVTQVSWMIPAKGIEDLLEAARIAREKDPRLHFALVGEGPQRAQFAEKARALGIAEHVTWTGLVEDPHSAGVYGAADIVCQMSRWEEAFGMVIAEAMVYARPVVATRVGGIPELVRDGETGFLVTRGDREAMAARIVELAASAEARERMGCAGRALAEREFDVRKTTTQLMRVFGLDDSAG